MPDLTPTLESECFFIAPIGEEGSETRRRSDGVLNFIVARAAEELGLIAIRADQIATPGQITLQVIDHILQAKAAVADLTGWNANVVYELAVRHSARLPVALIVAQDDPPLPFDIAQMRAIRFDHRDLTSADQCRQAIVAHLREAFDGAVDSPIAASIDLRALGAGDRVERSIAEVLTGIAELGKLQQAVLEAIDVEELEALKQELELERSATAAAMYRLGAISATLSRAVAGLESEDDAIRDSAVSILKALSQDVHRYVARGGGPSRVRRGHLVLPGFEDQVNDLLDWTIMLEEPDLSAAVTILERAGYILPRRKAPEREPQARPAEAHLQRTQQDQKPAEDPTPKPNSPRTKARGRRPVRDDA